MPKRFPATAQLARQGVDLCASIVSDMGHIWREKAVSDVGIDGEIELVDPATRGVLGRLLLVQSKARSGAFDHETEHGFSFRCTQDDLEYWLSASAPVLLVCSHPKDKHAWFKNVTAWFGEQPDRRRNRVIAFDKTADRFDVGAAPQLVEWGVPVSSGVYLRPPPRPETLTTNLLRVEHVAPVIHVAPSAVRGWKDINARLRAAGHRPVSDVVWRDKLIYSFRPLDASPLDVLADDTPERLGTDELADSKSEDDRRLLVRLLNKTLREMHHDLHWHHDRQFLFFPATRDLSARKVRGTRGGNGRTVFAPYLDRQTHTRVVYYRHYALRSQFLHLDDGWFLALNPTYHFTRDGQIESRYASDYLKKIKQIEGHQAVATLTRFWAGYLRSRHDLFSTPDQRIRFGLLAEVDLAHGIDDAMWKPRDKAAVVDLGTENVEQPSLEGMH